MLILADPPLFLLKLSEAGLQSRFHGVGLFLAKVELILPRLKCVVSDFNSSHDRQEVFVDLAKLSL